mmetsp:Transcript_88598/g.247843  ORF Transcript_88598/g.247843 Transcript_88598/m.247843 type:complete len:254 (+) Transcript_88598:60-821(+)
MRRCRSRHAVRPASDEKQGVRRGPPPRGCARGRGIGRGRRWRRRGARARRVSQRDAGLPTGKGPHKGRKPVRAEERRRVHPGQALTNRIGILALRLAQLVVRPLPQELGTLHFRERHAAWAMVREAAQCLAAEGAQAIRRRPGRLKVHEGIAQVRGPLAIHRHVHDIASVTEAPLAERVTDILLATAGRDTLDHQGGLRTLANILCRAPAFGRPCRGALACAGGAGRVRDTRVVVQQGQLAAVPVANRTRLVP